MCFGNVFRVVYVEKLIGIVLMRRFTCFMRRFIYFVVLAMR